MKTIAFPIHHRLNNQGQFDKLAKDGQGRWFLLQSSTGQKRRLEGIEVELALSIIVTPLLA